jgi:penicillin-binding protein 1C
MDTAQGKLKFLFRKRKLLFALICFVIGFYLFLLILPFPELDAFRERSWGTAISDRNGTVLRVLPASDGVKREWASLGEIPPGAVKIFIHSEDRRFYFHPGIDIIAIGRSFLRNAQERRVVSGASTITMQLARMVNPHSGGISGKLREAWDAIRLEVKLSKKEILELWLNSIPFGSNIEGLPAMTRSRFGRPISQLDDNRAALLAAVPRRPGFYDPAVNQDAAVSAALALSERSSLGLREDELLNAAKEAATVLQGPEDPRSPFFAPHFTERMRLSDENNNAASATKVRSTLDLGFQRYAEELLTLELSLLSRNRVSNGAILVIENDTGAVRVYVGSASWFNDAVSGKIDGVRFRGQPGSCLKPFLYALAIDAGFGPADIMPDIPTVFGTREAYIPSNFNNRFNGPVRLRIALASSLNIPAVYLLERLGVNAFEEYLVGLGFDSIMETMGTHGTGLALGNAEVSLEEMVRGFSAFPRGGSPAELIWIEGNTPSQSVELAPPLMSQYAAWMIADMLSDRSSRFVGFGPAPALVTPFVSMFKTGTANQFQHIWALGATKRFTVGVWMGNFSGETVIGSTGSSIPASIASRLLTALEQSAGADNRGNVNSLENIGGPVPAGVTETQICALSGMTSGPYCTGLVREWIRNEKIPSTCTWHTGAGLFYPPEYQAWLTERFRLGAVMQGGSGRIRNPVSGSVYYLDPSVPPNAQALRVETNGFSVDALVYSDGVLQGSLNHAGVYALPLSRGQHTVLVEDIDGTSAVVNFEVR